MILWVLCLGTLIKFTLEACDSCDPSGQFIANTMQGYGDYNPAIGSGSMSGGMLGFGGIGGRSGMNYESF